MFDEYGDKRCRGSPIKLYPFMRTQMQVSRKLTGKPWSAKLTPSAETLRKLREKHGGELESWWQDAFGYGFDFLTESEARYLARADSVELIRNRILAARQAHDD